MTQGSATLVVDLGNSSTKCKVLFGKDSSTGQYRWRKFEIPNVFAPIEDDYVVSSDYDDVTSTILRVDATLDGREIKGDFCCGELQQVERALNIIKPSGSAKKYNLDSTVLSFRMAFLNAYRAIMAMHRVSDYSQLDISWTVVTMLPPEDVASGTEPIKAIINSITNVESVFPKANIPVNVTKSFVFPEGYCAYIGVVYDVGHVYRPDYKFLLDETVLVIDIGAGTSDILIMRNNKLVQNSMYTITQGGNNVHQIVRRNLRVKEDIDIEDAALKTGILKGFIKDGAKTVSIVDMVNKAKESVSRKLVDELQNYIDGTDVKMKSIGYVLVCGGGSMQDSDCDEIVPLSKSVLEALKYYSPNSELIELPLHNVVKEDDHGVPYSVTEQISPRELNLLGASILAEIV